MAGEKTAMVKVATTGLWSDSVNCCRAEYSPASSFSS